MSTYTFLVYLKVMLHRPLNTHAILYDTYAMNDAAFAGKTTDSSERIRNSQELSYTASKVRSKTK